MNLKYIKFSHAHQQNTLPKNFNQTISNPTSFQYIHPRKKDHQHIMFDQLFDWMWKWKKKTFPEEKKIHSIRSPPLLCTHSEFPQRDISCKHRLNLNITNINKRWANTKGGLFARSSIRQKRRIKPLVRAWLLEQMRIGLSFFAGVWTGIDPICECTHLGRNSTREHEPFYLGQTYSNQKYRSRIWSAKGCGPHGRVIVENKPLLHNGMLIVYNTLQLES